MQLIFNTYFSTGFSPSKLPYEHQIFEDAIIFTENLPEIITACENHVADAAPWVYQFTTTGSAASLISATGAASIEEFGNIKYLWFSVVPNLLALQTTLSNYSPPEEPETVVLEKFASKNILLTTGGELLTSVQPNEIIVSKNSGQFTSIVAAINYLNSLTDKNVIIRVYPGIYYETAPIELPDFVCLIGEGSAGNTTIVGVHGGSVIKTSAFNFVKNLHLIGGTIGLHHEGSNYNSFSLIKDCMIKISDTSIYGIKACCGLGSLTVSHLSLYAEVPAPTTTAVFVEEGSFIASELIIQAAAAEGIRFLKGIGTLDLVSIYYAAKGICCEGSTIIKGTLLNLISCTTGLHIMPAAETPHICVNYFHIDGSTTDILLDSKANLELYSGHIDPDKITKNVPNTLSGNFYTDDEGVQQNLLGRSHVHGSLTFLPDQKFSTGHLNIFENYIEIKNYASFFCENSLTEIKYFNNSGWETVPFVTLRNFYWLPLDLPHTAQVINGISGNWLQVSATVTEAEFTGNSQMLIEDKTLYLNSARKKKELYPTGSTFIIPQGADTTMPYIIAIKANIGITCNGTYYPQNYIEVSAPWTEGLQSFSYSATGLTMLAIKYYQLYN